jgi:hypothetical protein
VTVSGSDDVVNFAFTITPGYYTVESLIETITTGGAIVASFVKPGFLMLSLSTDTVLNMSSTLASMLGFDVNGATGPGYMSRFVIPDGDFLVASRIPIMGTTPVVYVVARQVAMNNMVGSNSNEYDVLATVSMHDTPYGSYASYVARDVFIDDIDFRQPRAISRIDFELLDYAYQPLTIDKRFPVVIQLKVYHTDTVKG